MLANAERWELSVTNSSNTAYSRITLRPSFFSQYRPLGNKAARQRGISCKLHVKVGYDSSSLTPVSPECSWEGFCCQFCRQGRPQGR